MKLKDIKIKKWDNGKYVDVPFGSDFMNYALYDRKGQLLLRTVKDAEGILETEVLGTWFNGSYYTPGIYPSGNYSIIEIMLDFENEEYVYDDSWIKNDSWIMEKGNEREKSKDIQDWNKDTHRE